MDNICSSTLEIDEDTSGKCSVLCCAKKSNSGRETKLHPGRRAVALVSVSTTEVDILTDEFISCRSESVSPENEKNSSKYSKKMTESKFIADSDDKITNINSGIRLTYRSRFKKKLRHLRDPFRGNGWHSSAGKSKVRHLGICEESHLDLYLNFENEDNLLSRESINKILSSSKYHMVSDKSNSDRSIERFSPRKRYSQSCSLYDIKSYSKKQHIETNSRSNLRSKSYLLHTV